MRWLPIALCLLVAAPGLACAQRLTLRDGMTIVVAPGAAGEPTEARLEVLLEATGDPALPLVTLARLDALLTGPRAADAQPLARGVVIPEGRLAAELAGLASRLAQLRRRGRLSVLAPPQATSAAGQARLQGQLCFGRARGDALPSSLLTLARRLVVRSRLTLVVRGDVALAEVRAAVRAGFAAIPPGERVAPRERPKASAPGARTATVEALGARAAVALSLWLPRPLDAAGHAQLRAQLRWEGLELSCVGRCLSLSLSGPAAQREALRARLIRAIEQLKDAARPVELAPVESEDRLVALGLAGASGGQPQPLRAALRAAAERELDWTAAALVCVAGAKPAPAPLASRLAAAEKALERSGEAYLLGFMHPADLHALLASAPLHRLAKQLDQRGRLLLGALARARAKLGETEPEGRWLADPRAFDPLVAEPVEGVWFLRN